MSDYASFEKLLNGRSIVDVPCPLCSPYRKPAHRRLKVLRLWRVSPVMLTYKCMHCDAHGALFHDSDRPAIAPDRSAMEAAQARQEREERGRIERARSFYQRARPAGFFGYRYFDDRGLSWPDVLSNQLRMAENQLVMPFISTTTREVTGVHRISLFTRPGEKRWKKSFGRVSGSAMMLGRPSGDPQPVLAICEGLETGVAILGHDPSIPVWCLSGASFMAGFGPLEGVERLIIYSDNDANRAGQEAARACSALWREHADVTVVTPSKTGSDFADLWRR